MYSIPSTLLDWEDTSQHVCNIPRFVCVLFSFKYSDPDIVNIASYLLLNRASNAQKFSPKGVHRAIKLLIFTAVVFRSEVALLLAPILLQSWLSGRTTLGDIIKVGLVSGLKSIGKF